MQSAIILEHLQVTFYFRKHSIQKVVLKYQPVINIWDENNTLLSKSLMREVWIYVGREGENETVA